MLPYLNNAQLKQLQGVLEGVLSGVELSHSAGIWISCSFIVVSPLIILRERQSVAVPCGKNSRHWWESYYRGSSSQRTNLFYRKSDTGFARSQCPKRSDCRITTKALKSLTAIPPVNDNLLATAQAVYKAWFVEYKPFGGKDVIIHIVYYWNCTIIRIYPRHICPF